MIAFNPINVGYVGLLHIYRMRMCVCVCVYTRIR